VLTIEHAIDTNPDNPENWIIKADMLARHRKTFAGAEECYRAAIKLVPDDPHYQKQAAEYWTKLGDLFFS
jgi:cytochrome c-type biogenesis protein CcmH/NrfG